MKIIELTIYNFGQHSNKTIDFTKLNTVVYGLNESGKTTIQQFILQILFGFPQKNSTYFQYDTKASGQFGGQIQIEDEKYGICTIERVRKEKVVGDVTVYFENGVIGDEQDLLMLMRNYDRASFEAIFSFSMLQLQHFEKMTEEELTRTLLASGTTGVDTLVRIEKQMEKEMGELFKKTGRNPSINAQLHTLKELHKEVREMQQKIAHFEPMRLRAEELERDLHQIEQEKAHYEQRQQSLQLIKQYLPLYNEEKSLSDKLKPLNDMTFPANGIRRLELLEDQLLSITTKKQALQEKIDVCDKYLSEVASTEALPLIEAQLATERVWHEWHTKHATIIEEQAKLEEQLQKIYQRLGGQEKSNRFLDAADVSIQKEEEMVQLLSELDDIQREERVLEERYKQLEIQLDEQENVNQSNSTSDEKMKEWPRKREAIMQNRVLLQGYTEQLKLRFIPHSILAVAAIFILLGIMMSMMIPLVIGIFITIAGVFSWIYIKRIKEKKDLIENEITDDSTNLVEQEQRYEEYLIQVQQAQFHETALRTLRRDLTTIQEKLAQILRSNYEKNMQLEQFMGEYGFEGMYSAEIVPQLFRLIREAQDCKRKSKQLMEQQFQIEQKITEREQQLSEITSTEDSEAIFVTLRKLYTKLIEVAENTKRVTTQRSEYEDELHEEHLKEKEVQQTIQKLLAESSVDSTAAFYEKDEQYEKKKMYEAKLENVQAQLPNQLLNDFHHYNEMTVEEALKENTVLLNQVGERQVLLIEQKAELQSSMHYLIADESYYEKRQQLEMKKAAIHQLMKRWAALKAVSESIAQTMNMLKEQQLPRVLEKAQSYFLLLTNKRYRTLQFIEEGYFLATDQNGVRFHMKELSQATKEQAYISLRFALASSLQEQAPFPIIMDDPFVHFDEQRLSSMMKVIQKFSHHQFIYFTCHKKVRYVWQDAEFITLDENINKGAN